MEVVLPVVLLAALVAFVVLQPLHSAPDTAATDDRSADLEAAKESKYREIKDAELDREMGKLSQDDWRSVDRDLRGEAIEILRELDRLEGR